MMQVLARLSGLLSPGRRGSKRRAAGRRRSQELFPTLQVRVLEERRVFHAGAIVAPVSGTTPQQPPPPPPPTTYVTLDAAQNLVVNDGSGAGQNDQLTIRFDAAAGHYAISDPTHLLTSDIAGSAGSGSHTVFVPLAAVVGDKLIVATGQGDDTLSTDLSAGLAGKSLVFDGGVGQDSLALVGGSYSAVGYQFESDGTVQIQVGAGSSPLQIELISVEPIIDQMVAQNREFTLANGISGVALAGLDASSGGQMLLSTSLGSSVTFAAPGSSLSLHAAEEARVELIGELNLEGGDLEVRAGSIEVDGTVTTSHARIQMSAESSLTVMAGGVLNNSAGEVFLDAGESGTLRFSGRIDVSAVDTLESGGEVHLLGGQVEMLDASVINASGNAGGGTVLVGGDYQGINPAIRRAANTLVSATSSITANALVQGDGGKIIIWADQSAIVAGSGNLQARGGPQGGNGGLIETSGKRYLYVDAAPDASAPAGTPGMWLLDPFNVTIATGGTVQLNNGVLNPTATTTISPATIAAALNNQDVTINTTGSGTDAGNIVVMDAIIASPGGTNTLTLNAQNHIEILAAITCTSGNLDLVLNGNLAGTGGHVLVRAAVTTSGGDITSTGDDFDSDVGTINTGGGNLTINHTGDVAIAENVSLGDGTFSSSGVGFNNTGGSINTGDGALTISHSSGAVLIGADITTGTGDATIVGSSIAFGAATLSTNDANLTAGAITGGTAANDIVVTGTNPSILLSSASIGSSGNLMALSAGSSPVSLTASTGGIFVHFAAGFSTSQLTVSAAGTAQTIQLATSTGNITVNSTFNVNTQDDNFILATAGTGLDINFTGGTTLTGRSVLLSASGDITTNSANSIANTSAVNGNITLIASSLGTSANPLQVNPGTGNLALTASTGDIHIRLAAGTLLTSRISTLSALSPSATISLSAPAITVDSVSSFNPNTFDDDFSLNASAGSITLSSGAPLVGASATLTASAGSILAAGAGTKINTSAANGSIHLQAREIGTGQAIVINPGSGSVNAIASIGDVFLTFANSFNTSQLTNLSVAGMNMQIVLSSATGSITVGGVVGFNNNTTDDHFSLLAPAGGVAFSAGTLVGQSVTINAQTTITRSGTAANDINTSAADGAITLTANDGIGTSGDPLRVNADSGIVQATTNIGSVWLSAPSIRLGQVQTGLGQQIVSVDTTTGNLDIIASSVTDDDWQLDSADDLRLVGAVSLQAATFSSLLATNNVVSGAAAADFIQVGPVGTIAIDAGQIGTLSDPIRVDADPLAKFNLKTNTGDLAFVLVDGNLDASRFVGNMVAAPLSGVTIHLETENGFIDLGAPSFLVNAPSGNALELEAHGLTGDIIINGSTLIYSEVTLIADGTISSLVPLGPSIDTRDANGDITLQSSGSIGLSQAAPLIVEAGTGEVSATTTGPGGDIFLQSTGNLSLGTIDTDDASTQIVSIFITGGPLTISGLIDTEDVIFLAALEDISFVRNGRIVAAEVALISVSGNINANPGTSLLPDVDTSAAGGLITLDGVSIGSAPNALLIDPGSGLVAVTADGSVFLDIDNGDFALSQFSALNLIGVAGQTFDLGVLDGSLTLDAAFGSLFDDNLVLSAAGAVGNITVGGVGISAASFNLNAAGSIQGGGNPADLTATAGSIILLADQDIGTGVGGTPLAVLTNNPAGFIQATADGGSISLLSPGLMRLDEVETDTGAANSVEIHAVGGLEIIATSDTNDTWTLGSTGGGLQFTGANTIVANAFTADVAGAILSNDPATDIDTSMADGAVSLTGLLLGDSLQHLVLEVGAGTVALESNAGDIWVDLAGGAVQGNQITSLTAGGIGTNVSLTTPDGSLAISNADTFDVGDDLVSLTAMGANSDIIFSGGGAPLVAQQVTLNAGGSILSSGAAALDIDTSSGNTPLLLTAGEAIGSSTSPLLVQAGLGNVAATAVNGDIYIQSPGALFVNHAQANAATRQVSFVTTGSFSPLFVSVNSLGNDGDDWHLRATGEIQLHVADVAGIQMSQIVEFNSSSPGQNVLIDASNGPLTIDALPAGFVTADDNLTLRAGGGDITAAPKTVLHAVALSLQAPAGQIGSQNDPINLMVQRLSASSAGVQWFETGGTVRIELAQTTGQDINLTSGTFFLDSPMFVAVDAFGGTLQVGSAAILRGSGGVLASLHVHTGGVIDMGFGDTGAGSLFVLGDVTIDDMATLIIDINPPYAMPGSDYDQFVLFGNLILNSPTLQLEGAEQLSTIVNPIALVELANPFAVTVGSFDPNAGSLSSRNGVLTAEVGLFRAQLVFNGGDGNDIVLSQVSFVPPVLPTTFRLPPLRIPVFTRTDLPPPVVQAPPQLAAASIPPLIEPEVTPVGLRYIEIRIVVPIDEAGNVREEFAMKLPAEWLANLPAVLRLLPDDRYRIYLMLEGGNEERLVMDVFVRDGRPIEPADTQEELALPLPADQNASDASMPAGSNLAPLPAPPSGINPTENAPEELTPPQRFPELGPAAHQSSGTSGRLFIGGAAAIAAVVASRRTSDRRAEEVDEAALAIGQTAPLKGWRWWRMASSHLT